MTQALVRAAAPFVVPPVVIDDTVLVSGTVIQVGPPVQVNVDGMQLACATLIGVFAGATVYVLRKGRTAVIIGKADAEITQHFSQSVAFTASAGTVTFPTAFPTTCDGAVWGFDGSVGAGSISPTGLGARAAATVAVIASGSATATLAITMWAWGH